MSRRKPHEFTATNVGADGAPIFWKSLEEKANSAEAQLRATAEFPLGIDEAKAKSLPTIARDDVAGDVNAPVGRRGFLTLAGITSALFAEGCARRPLEKILPYSKAPEQIIPGIPNTFATARSYRGEAIGLLVESHEGRPTKIEGNPDHAGSLGSTDAISQATVFDLYDPDRSQKPVHAQKMATWAEFDSALAEVVRQAKGDQGAKLRFLVEPTHSPTFIRLRDAVKAKFPQAKFHTYASVNESNAREGAKLAFGQPVNTVVDYANAAVILAADSDFLGTEAGSIRAMRGFADGRRMNSPADKMNRLYVVEPSLTTTGLSADHRLRLAAQDVEAYLVALAKELSAAGADLGTLAGSLNTAKPEAASEAWVKAVAKDLVANRGKSVVVVGSRQPARVHALAHAINAALGNSGKTVQYFPTADATEVDNVADIAALAADIKASKVGTLIILGGNPVYDAPSDIDFASLLKSVATSIHLSSHVDETSALATWHAPRAHELESWGDLRSMSGAVSVLQPLIAPLYDARSDIEILGKIAGEPKATGHELTRATFLAQGGDAVSLERTWNAGLKRGAFAANGVVAYASLSPRASEIGQALSSAKKPAAVSAQNLEVTFAADSKLFDGRHANNPWLLELPDSVTKITWDNAAYVSPSTAKALGVENGDMVRLSREKAQAIDIAIWVLPGQADNTIGLTLGWGRQEAGRYGSKHGFNVQPLRTSDAMGFASGVQLKKMSGDEVEQSKERYRRPGMSSYESPFAGRTMPNDVFDQSGRYKISQTQDHNSMEGRAIAIDATLTEYRENPKFVQYPNEKRGRHSGSPDPKVLPLWNKVDYSKGHKWGMSIDLNACTGCNACVIACQSENNIPVVGKEQVERGREMYWIRVDRYFMGEDENNPQVSLQPVACVHCEEAPCENVCPVNATEHSPEGLNDMAYNRCIGTRYCANNCPYKVRRFNFLNYHGEDNGKEVVIPETEKMHYNPNVTVRMRGVMEKCTYCVQRIQEGKIESKRTGKEIKDGDIKSACQQVCPAQAIVFGDLNDPNSRVAKLTKADRGYRLLAELGTAPRTTYLGKIRNPNAEMGEKG